MGLTYVDLLTDDGPLKMPNLGMLASAVGPAPAPAKPADEPTLYVDRALPKRPPRVTAPQGSRRQHRELTVRKPRDSILRTRKRRARSNDHPSHGSTEPDQSHSNKATGTPKNPEAD